jgi:MFS family permease
VAEAIAMGCLSALIAQLTPSELRGRVFGAWNASLSATTALGPLVAGYLIGIWIDLPYTIAGACILASCIYMLVWTYWKKNPARALTR